MTRHSTWQSGKREHPKGRLVVQKRLVKLRSVQDSGESSDGEELFPPRGDTTPEGVALKNCWGKKGGTLLGGVKRL